MPTTTESTALTREVLAAQRELARLIVATTRKIGPATAEYVFALQVDAWQATINRSAYTQLLAQAADREPHQARTPAHGELGEVMF